jgi:hypothetical protein
MMSESRLYDCTKMSESRLYMLTEIRCVYPKYLWSEVGSCVGLDRPKSLLLRNLRLAYVCRRRLQRNSGMDRRGTVAVVEEVPR